MNEDDESQGKINDVFLKTTLLGVFVPEVCCDSSKEDIDDEGCDM